MIMEEGFSNLHVVAGIKTGTRSKTGPSSNGKACFPLSFGDMYAFIAHVTSGTNRPAGVERPIFSPSDPYRGVDALPGLGAPPFGMRLKVDPTRRSFLRGQAFFFSADSRLVGCSMEPGGAWYSTYWNGVSAESWPGSGFGSDGW